MIRCSWTILDSRRNLVVVLGSLAAMSCATGGDPDVVAPEVGERDTPQPTGVVTGYTVAGGEILEITTINGTKIYPATLAQLAGTVYDSARGSPLPGATLTISGTDFTVVTDDSGAFRLAVPLEGRYRIALAHPFLDSLGLHSVATAVSLARNEIRSVSLVTPSMEAILTRLCGDTIIRADRQVLVGIVADKVGTGVPEARVTVGWQEVMPIDSVFLPQEFWHTEVTDDMGRFTVCGVRRGRRITLIAEKDNMRSERASLILPWSAAGRALLAWDREPNETYQGDYSAPYPIFKLDVVLDRDAARTWSGGTRIVTGIVADRMTGQGIEDVSVFLNGTESATTRADGTFDIADANWIVGRNVVAFRRIGYEPWTQELQFDADRSEIALSPLMLPTAIAMDPVYVEAARIRRVQHLEGVGFYRRAEVGFGHHLGPDEIDVRRPGASNVLDFMTGLPGVSTSSAIDAAGSVGQQMLVLRASFRECVPKVYVDELEIPDGAYVSSLSLVVRPEEVEAIEVYRRGTETPLRYGHACVVLIWTTRGSG